MENQKQYVTPYDFKGKLPLKQAIPLGLQHVLAMFVGNLTPLLVIMSACAAIGDAQSFMAIQVSLLQNAMLVAGIVTLVQLFSIGPIGGQVPIYRRIQQRCQCHGRRCDCLWRHDGSFDCWRFV